MKKAKLLVALLLVLVMALPLALAACNKTSPVDDKDIVERTDYTSVYDKIGKDVTIDMVEEGENGLAYVTVDGVKYELGMDFLSMAMVYNTTPIEDNEAYDTAEEIYNEWWKLYILRWNYLVPEVPLYSNTYYDVYNAKIGNFVTTPYWAPSDAIVAATSTDGKVIMGDTTELSGSFRNSSFGKTSPGAGDLAVQGLTSGYSTVVTDQEGAFGWADTSIVKSHEMTQNKDGTLTFTIEIANGLKFSDGSAITAKNYVASILAYSNPVMGEAGGTTSTGMYYVGYDSFVKNTTGGKDAVFSGVRLYSDNAYKFSLQVSADYANYYYVDLYASVSPVPMKLYFGTYDIKDDGNGCYIEEGFYATEQKDGIKSYTMAATIEKNVHNTDPTAIPYSGPYIVSKWDESNSEATLTLNTNYKGDHRGQATIQTIVYRLIVSETQLDQLKKGEIDILAGVTGATDTEAALAVVDNVKFKETHYDRAGYGKLAFVCDFGPTQFTSARQAVMYSINRPDYAQTFTGGHGSVVHGPYYTGMAAYVANADELEAKLNTYEFNVNKANEVLDEGGWVYNEKGETFDATKDAVRYKKLSGYELSYDNLHFASTDGKYKTVKVNGEYYMPLVINWMGTQPNTVTDLLITAWQTSANSTTKIGMYITYTSGDFNTALYGEYYQMSAYGFSGTATYGAVNFATGFTSAVYDQSYYWTINPDMYADYNSNLMMDEADFYANYSK